MEQRDIIKVGNCLSTLDPHTLDYSCQCCGVRLKNPLRLKVAIDPRHTETCSFRKLVEKAEGVGKRRQTVYIDAHILGLVRGDFRSVHLSVSLKPIPGCGQILAILEMDEPDEYNE